MQALPQALPVRVLPEPRIKGHISDEFFINLSAWKASTSAFVGGMAVGWLAYTDNSFTRRNPRSIDTWITELALFSAITSLSSAAIYGLSAAGTMWDMKVEAGWKLWKLPTNDERPPSPVKQVTLPTGPFGYRAEGFAVVLFDTIYILAPIPLIFSLAIFTYMEGSVVVRVVVICVAGLCMPMWAWRFLYAIRSLYRSADDKYYNTWGLSWPEGLQAAGGDGGGSSGGNRMSDSHSYVVHPQTQEEWTAARAPLEITQEEYQSLSRQHTRIRSDSMFSSYSRSSTGRPPNPFARKNDGPGQE